MKATSIGSRSEPTTLSIPGVALRYEVQPDDIATVRRIVESTGFFYAPEVDVAVELVEERLKRSDASGYQFVFAERDGRTIGYTCYGPIACTLASYDLYWIAVDSSERGHGLGRALMAVTETAIADRGGQRVYAETSGRDQYSPTRVFYERCGYEREATLKDFYASGDDKVVYGKRVGSW
jgi:GNAT superfamily N-acetyltransferase